ncbi:MAG: alpha/beta hydrolase family protein [Acidimicrobiales bacterium]
MEAEATATSGLKRRNYSPWYQWMVRLAETVHEDPLAAAIDDAASLDAWRHRCRSRLDDLLGPLPAKVPLDIETLETVRSGGYRREKVVFDTERTMSVPAYLLVPDDRVLPGAAVLAVHGHGPGKDQVCGLAVTETPNGDYAHQLAKRGYVVLAPDLRCFGERADWNPPDHYGCDTNLVHAAMAGWSPLTQNLWDLSRCIDVLAEHPLVDPARIGVAGLSYGGTMSLFLAAWDTRVAAAVVSGYFSSWAESHRVPWNMCGSQILAGMLGRLEHVDLGALVAPRPLLVETGTDDILFPVETAKSSIGELHDVYEELRAADRLVHDVFPGGHQWHGELAYTFLDRWLRHGTPPRR